MKAKTYNNLNFFEISRNLNISETEGTRSWYRAIKKAGYKFAYRWINSDDNWMWFTKTLPQAELGAAELYATEKKCTVKEAYQWRNDTIDVFDVDHILKEWF